MYELKRILSFNHPIRDLAQLSPQRALRKMNTSTANRGVINCLRRLDYFISVSQKYNYKLFQPQYSIKLGAPAQASNAGDRERCTAVSSKANRGENRILGVKPLESGVSPLERWLGEPSQART
jgi:hypothetical protein